MKETVKERVKKLRDDGFSFGDIGKLIGVTRQRAHQIYQEVSE